MAVEKFLEEHPFYLERLTMVQIAAPSRTRIPSYAKLQRQVEETVSGSTSASRRAIGSRYC